MVLSGPRGEQGRAHALTIHDRSAASGSRPSPGNVGGRAPQIVLLVAAIAFPLVAGKVQMSVGRQVYRHAGSVVAVRAVSPVTLPTITGGCQVGVRRHIDGDALCAGG